MLSTFSVILIFNIFYSLKYTNSLKKGYKPEDIHVFSQISSPDRFELLVNKNDIDDCQGIWMGVGESFTMTTKTHKDMDDLDGFGTNIM